MNKLATESEKNAAIAAMARGDFGQIRHLVDHLEAKMEALKEERPLPQVSTLSTEGVEPVEPLAPDAKSADVKEAVAVLQERFNQLIKKLKG